MVLRMYVAWRLAQAEEVRRKAVLEPRAQRLGSSPVASVAEDVVVVVEVAVERILDDGADEGKRAGLIPDGWRGELALSTVFNLLVQRLDFVMVIPQDDVPTGLALHREFEWLGWGGDQDHLDETSAKHIQWNDLPAMAHLLKDSGMLWRVIVDTLDCWPAMGCQRLTYELIQHSTLTR